MSGSHEERLRRVQLLELEEAKSAKTFLKDYADDLTLEGDTSEELTGRVNVRLAQEVAKERLFSQS
jgi:hypothetical protein